MNETTKAVLKDIVHEILEEMDELVENKEEKENWWQSLAYATVLSRIKMRIDRDTWKDFNILRALRDYAAPEYIYTVVIAPAVYFLVKFTSGRINYNTV